ncbi:homoserine kinase [Sulfuriferula nivalis]|uniref:Homoserine kinase n=1 Tax=Sulfuriferula nivalis TaxID=2675298 RepID=A0A809SIE8_9PROT|nr:homoserine kinase [Sulfuriferula nivalis]BBP01760.1 homoserine kinase [Sulfuriferula nivalis]
MSVFTTVSEDQARAWLDNYPIGQLTELRGIASGIENTNYFLSTDQGKYVLTLFENLTASELPYFLNLMHHLASQNVPCPLPIANAQGELLSALNGKPASIVTRLTGASLTAPTTSQCAAMGATLAQIHIAGKNFPMQRDNERSAAWWKATSPQLLPFLDAEAAQLLQAEIKFQALHRLQDLPRGVIHADLFRDNVLFDGDTVSGVIDFYFACNDAWLYDIAITVNDWCVTANGELDETATIAFLQAYHRVRPFTAIERGAWPITLRAAALRFWVSRLYDLHFPRAGEMTHAKDPSHFERILRNRILTQSALQRMWVS